MVDRVASVNAMLYNAAGQVGLLVHPQCTELITDFFQVAWMKNDQTEIDKKTDRQRTHWSDALDYLIYRDFRVDPFQRQISLPDGSSYIAG